uniref:Uncharacterized protein n=1 Tax=Arundo donax TaxID=35708 RepID=A0A0A9BM85_ARUDO
MLATSVIPHLLPYMCFLNQEADRIATLSFKQ